MAAQEKNMLSEFLATVFKFILKMFLWAVWACFRVLELISQGIANWIKNTLTD